MILNWKAMNRMSILRGLLRFKNILYVSGHGTGYIKNTVIAMEPLAASKTWQSVTEA